MMDIVTIGTVCLPVWGKNKNFICKTESCVSFWRGQVCRREHIEAK